MNAVEKVVRFLAQATLVNMNDVLLLCGNGSGAAALRIVRGMFESSTVAEYVLRNPPEAENYLAFGPVIAWRRFQWFLKNNPEKPFTAERSMRIEQRFNQVKSRFTDTKGKMRSNWSIRKIRQMADAIGREDQYELVYSWLSSMHHLSPDAMMAHVEDDNGVPTLQLDCAPSKRWLNVALVGAHTYVLFAAQTINDCFALKFENEIRGAEEEFQKAGLTCSN